MIEQFPRQSARVSRVWTAVFVSLVPLAYLAKSSDSFSRGWTIAWYLTTLGLLVSVHLAAAAQIRAGGRGAGSPGPSRSSTCRTRRKNRRQIRRFSAGDAYLVGVFRANGIDPGVDSVADLLALARLFRIDEVLVIVSPDTVADIPKSSSPEVPFRPMCGFAR